jgi:hypothetical protein
MDRDHVCDPGPAAVTARRNARYWRKTGIHFFSVRPNPASIAIRGR